MVQIQHDSLHILSCISVLFNLPDLKHCELAKTNVCMKFSRGYYYLLRLNNLQIQNKLKTLNPKTFLFLVFMLTPIASHHKKQNKLLINTIKNKTGLEHTVHEINVALCLGKYRHEKQRQIIVKSVLRQTEIHMLNMQNNYDNPLSISMIT